MGEVTYYRTNATLISYPKSGRTWLRMILAKCLEEKGVYSPNIEFIYCRHWTVDEANKMDSLRSNYIYLQRDVRDVMVSYYFEKSRRIKHKYKGTLSEFLRSEFGVEACLRHRKQWGYIADLIITYESLHENPVEVIASLFDFSDYKVSRDKIKKSVEYCKFEKMKRMEVKGKSLISKYRGRFGKGHDKNDPESFRCRKGKVGGYVDYLSEEDLQYIKEMEEKYK